MSADIVHRRKAQRQARNVFTLPFALPVLLAAAATAFVSYVLWPTWPSAPVSLDAPAIPITVAGVLFDVPPAAIRAAVQRHPGQQERIDLEFMWPSLLPPQPNAKTAENSADEPAVKDETSVTKDRLFVTLAGLGAILPPLERLRTIYPRYVEAQAAAGREGLAILPFRAGTPYDGEDLVYFGADPEKFFARCTRPARSVPGTCMQERALDAAGMTLRFPRDWLGDWLNVAAGFDRLIAQLHPQGK